MIVFDTISTPCDTRSNDWRALLALRYRWLIEREGLHRALCEEPTLPTIIKSMLVLGVLLASSAHAQSTKFYDRNGNYQGQASQEGSRTVTRDRNGNAWGYSQPEGSHTVYRDKNGNRLGSSR